VRRRQSRGDIHEPCNDNLQHDRRLDGDSHRFVVGSAENYASAPTVRSRQNSVSVRPRRPLRNHNQSGLSKPVYQHSCRREISKFLNRG
jgi:hypothetical protein